METKVMAPTPVIFESPDGGETVYRRESGSSQRDLHSISERQKKLRTELQEQQLWARIHRTAADDPILSQILEQAMIYYKLKHENLP